MKVSEYFPLVMVSLRKHLCRQRLPNLKSRKTLNLHFWSKIAGEIAKIFLGKGSRRGTRGDNGFFILAISMRGHGVYHPGIGGPDLRNPVRRKWQKPSILASPVKLCFKLPFFNTFFALLCWERFVGGTFIPARDMGLLLSLRDWVSVQAVFPLFHQDRKSMQKHRKLRGGKSSFFHFL